MVALMLKVALLQLHQDNQAELTLAKVVVVVVLAVVELAVLE
jgi:hypothetical protein